MCPRDVICRGSAREETRRNLLPFAPSWEQFGTLQSDCLICDGQFDDQAENKDTGSFNRTSFPSFRQETSDKSSTIA
jgi:hypothetical protein